MKNDDRLMVRGPKTTNNGDHLEMWSAAIWDNKKK